MNTNPKRGPFHYRSPARIFWRTVRGMIPHKTFRGKQALARLQVNMCACVCAGVRKGNVCACACVRVGLARARVVRASHLRPRHPNPSCRRLHLPPPPSNRHTRVSLSHSTKRSEWLCRTLSRCSTSRRTEKRPCWGFSHRNQAGSTQVPTLSPSLSHARALSPLLRVCTCEQTFSYIFTHTHTFTHTQTWSRNSRSNVLPSRRCTTWRRRPRQWPRPRPRPQWMLRCVCRCTCLAWHCVHVVCVRSSVVAWVPARLR